MVDLWYEVVHLRRGPDGTVRGVRSDFPRVEMVQVVADPNPMPPLRLLAWRRR
jgi:hypothetical protein